MRFTRPFLAFCAGAAALGAAAAPAVAAPCGTFVADDGDNVIVVGEYVNDVGGTSWRYRGSGKVGVCWLDAAGAWRFEAVDSCGSSSTASQALRIEAGAGNDVVVPVVRENASRDFWCPASPRGMYLWPYHLHPGDTTEPTCSRPEGCANGAFRFGLEVIGGAGEDTLHGTPNADTLRSSWLWALTPHHLPDAQPDQASDAMCGYAGRDVLQGDPNGAAPGKWTNSDCFDGGAGAGVVDSCYSNDPSSSTADSAITASCESGYGTHAVGENYLTYDEMGCCSAQAGPGCAPHWQDEVEACVCEADPYCCTTRWDAACAAQVETQGCGACGEGIGGQSGCWETCRNTTVAPVGATRWVVPPLIRTIAARDGRLWLFFKTQVRR